jgi:hypothetical protein
VADCDYFEGWGLLRRGRDGDRERALALLAAAAEGYRTIGMTRHLQMAEELGKA